MKATTQSITLVGVELERIGETRLLDVRFDGHRVWSVRAKEPVGGKLEIKWPRALREKLSGRTELTVENTDDASPVASRSARFGRSRQRVTITDKRGNWLAMTKWDRLGPVLEGSDDNVSERLLSSARRLVDDMQQWGYPVYIVGGTLLGITRNGALLPHDDDIDLAFLSDEDNPLDLGRVSFEMERQLIDAGYTVVRHSLAQLEIVFFDDAGEIDHYIDIFTGFFRDGLYCQPFALRSDLVSRDDLVPTQDIDVNGVLLPAPADPEAWLAYAYGENWRIPDPTFKFRVESGTKFRFGSWFGIYNRGRYFWEKHYQGRTEVESVPDGNEDVDEFLSVLPAGANVIDLGCADGSLTEQFASRGHRAIGVDYSYEALRVARQNASEGTTYLRVNLNDRAATMELASQVLRTRKVWNFFLRDTLHGLTYVNRENVIMMLAASLRGSGLAYVTYYNTRSVDYRRGDPRTWFISDKRFAREVAEHGLEIVSRHPGTRIGGRSRSVAVLRRTAALRQERTAWTTERDEDIQ